MFVEARTWRVHQTDKKKKSDKASKDLSNDKIGQRLHHEISSSLSIIKSASFTYRNRNIKNKNR